MTQTVNFTTVDTAVPASTVPGGFVVTILDAGNAPVASQTVPDSASAAVFDVMAPGTYTATVQAVDNAGNPLGTLATSTPFEIAAPATITVQTASTVSVTVAP